MHGYQQRQQAKV
uniref:Uncharacterized protein n=1 Tax=Anguilla anguilla TaxID=7936 RepID=A0A0E9PTQ8_ANGAN